MIRVARTILLAGMTSLLAFANPLHAEETSPVASHPLIGEEAPPIRLATVAGDTLALGDLRGSYVVIHFGTSW